MPDPFVLAVLLTALIFLLAMLLTDHSAGQVAAMWAGTLKRSDTPGVFGSDGLWSLLKFAMQMCLILVTGQVLASSPPVAATLRALSRLPRTNPQGAALIAAVGCLLGVLNWGLGLMAGAILARRVFDQLQERGTAPKLALFAAAGFTPMMVWHGGLSGSAPLTVTSLSGIQSTLGASAAILPEPIAISRTIFSPLNLIVTGGLLVIVPLVMGLMARGGPSTPVEIVRAALRRPPPAEAVDEGSASSERIGVIPRFLEESPIINLALAGFIAVWLVQHFLPAGGTPRSHSLGLDAVNLTMLMLGLVLHGTPRRFLQAVDEAASGCGGIIIQFPLYAGIMGIMAGTGLTKILADAIAGSSGAGSLPILTFFAAGVVNMFIPSGGAQWAVQGPIALEAARTLGVDPALMVMSIAYGDQVTNMLQPFWALPQLSITRARAQEVLGYSAMAMLIAGAWIGLWLLVFGGK